MQLAHDWVLAGTPLDGQSLEGLMGRFKLSWLWQQSCEAHWKEPWEA